MNAIGIIKPVVEFTIGWGVGAVVNNIIKFTTPLEQTCLQKVAVKIGSIVISAAVATAVANATLKPFQEFGVELAKAKAQLKKAYEEKS